MDKLLYTLHVSIIHICLPTVNTQIKLRSEQISMDTVIQGWDAKINSKMASSKLRQHLKSAPIFWWCSQLEVETEAWLKSLLFLLWTEIQRLETRMLLFDKQTSPWFVDENILRDIWKGEWKHLIQV